MKSKKWAAVEMVAAVVLMVVMCICLVRTWRQSEKLLDSMKQSADSYKIVVADGKDIFEETHKTLPTHIEALRTISRNLGGFADGCKKTSEAFEKIPDWHGLKSLRKILIDFAKQPVPSVDKIKASLDACAATLHRIHNKEKHDHICKAFDDTSASLDKAKQAMEGIKRSLRSVITLIAIVMVLGCSGMFCQGLNRWRAASREAQPDGSPQN